MATTLITMRPAETRFGKSVKPPTTEMLKPGKNNAKLGDIITAGKWKGMKLYSLTLEERKTCPTTCQQWGTCYGDNMPFAHRFDHTSIHFMPMIHEQLSKLDKKHAKTGYVVRLHVLGDFFSPAYIEWWEAMMNVHPLLNVFGYTHRPPKSTMGMMIDSLNARMPGRWQVRFSDDPSTMMSAHVVDENYVPLKGSEVICPEQMGQAASCAACGLCWSQPNRKIMFKEH